MTASDDAPAPSATAAAATPARRGRPRKTKNTGAGETRDAILNAAEDLFSKHGFYGVTIREVAREAGVDTALVHYYFGAKKDLFDAVFERQRPRAGAVCLPARDRRVRSALLNGL